MALDEIVQGTLDWCNEIRAEKDLPELTDLPKGKRTDMASCPCGAATGCEVGYHNYYAPGGGIRLGTVPEVVHRFTVRFDSGTYPEYDIDLEEGVLK